MNLASLLATGLYLFACTAGAQAGPSAPGMAAPPAGFTLVVSSPDSCAREAVVRGINHLLTSWDEAAFFEFRTAAALDPSCAMAWWGILLSTLGSDHDEERAEALAVLSKLSREGQLLPQEHFLCEAAALLLARGTDAAEECLGEYAERFPRDPLPQLWRIVFLRDGYDAFGNARPRQERAVNLADELLARRPDNHTALFLRALLEETAPAISERALACARRAVHLAPEHPVSRLLLAHLLARTGLHAEAAAQFAEAANLYERCHHQDTLAAGDDDGRIRALLGLAVAQWKSGQSRESLQTRRLLKSIPIDPERLNSRKSRLILWEVRTLPARLALAGTRPIDAGDITACMAAAAVPGMPKNDPARPYLRCLKSVMEARLALSGGDRFKAQQCLTRAEEDLASLGSPLFLPGEGKDTTCVQRAREASRIAIDATRALLTPSSAEIWQQDARETARPSSALLPPPMP